MNHIEAMKQALESLNKTQRILGEFVENHRNPNERETVCSLLDLHDTQEGYAIRKALHQAIESAEKQEPVAWRYTNAKGVFRYIKHRHDLDMAKDFAALDPLPLYATPPAAQRQWVGLTEEEVDECYYWKDRQWTTDELVRHVEAKLKEKNT